MSDKLCPHVFVIIKFTAFAYFPHPLVIHIFCLISSRPKIKSKKKLALKTKFDPMKLFFVSSTHTLIVILCNLLAKKKQHTVFNKRSH